VKKEHKEKMITKIKLMHSTAALVFIAFTALAIIGSFSFISSSKLNRYYNKMSVNNMNAIETYSSLSGSFNELRLHISVILDKSFTFTAAAEVDKTAKVVSSYIDNRVPQEDEVLEKTIFEQVKNNFTQYLKSYNDIKNIKAEGREITAEESKSLQDLGTAIDSGIKELINNQKQIIDEDILAYKSISNSNNIIFLVVAGTSSILLLIISITVIKSLRQSVTAMSATIEAIAGGDFTSEITTTSRTEFGLMNRQLDSMKKTVAVLLQNIKEVAANLGQEALSLSVLSEQMSESSAEVSQAIEQVAYSSASQASELMRANETINAFGDTLDEFALLTRQVNTAAEGIGSMADSNNGKLEKLLESFDNISETFDRVIKRIEKLESSIAQVNGIISLINSISEQTNLLALNAAIESARAGEAGRGFSVVAEEIRKLANQSKESSNKISSLLDTVSQETADLVGITGAVNHQISSEVVTISTSIESFRAIIISVEKMIPDIERINLGMSKLISDKDGLIKKIVEINTVSEENSASAQEITAEAQEMNISSNSVNNTAQNLSASAERLTEEINKFKL
jgi:methyl-accepting chemotaxis protein